MSKEEILQQIKTQQSIIKSASKKIEDLLYDLDHVDAESWDWITVKQGAEMLRVTPNVIYKKIDTGLLSVKYVGAKKLIKKSEIEAVNDV